MLKLLKNIGIIVLTLLILLIAFSLFRPDPWITSSTKENQIGYSGKISFEGYEKLIESYDKAKNKPSTLKITSTGGHGLAGILIGRFVKEKGMGVQVHKYCASSCANYVFPAGKQKRLSDDALVMYHGGYFQENLLSKMLTNHQSKKVDNLYKDNNANNEAALFNASEVESKLKNKYFPDKGACTKPLGDTEVIAESALRCLKFKQDIEVEFFALLNVDPKLPYYGQKGDYKASYQAYKHSGFYYDLKSLEKMGLDNIEIIGGDWKPSENIFFEKLYKISL